MLMQQTWDSGKVNAKGEALDTEQRRDGEAVLAKVRNRNFPYPAPISTHPCVSD